MKFIPVPHLPWSALGATTLLLAFAAQAHTEREGYTQFLDADTPKVVRDGFSGCVRTGDWSEQNKLPECGGGPMADKPRMASDKDKMMEKSPAVPPPPRAETPAQITPEPMPAEVKPMPPAPRAEAAPVVARPKGEPDMEKITLGAEALFASGKSALKPGAKAELDAVSAKIVANPVSGITITGHTDRTGSAALNKKLSMQRAMTVKSYLVGRGVPAAKITAEGKASSESRTTAGDCGTLKGKALAACLQPDRRVEVTLVR